jgi:plastocyanin
MQHRQRFIVLGLAFVAILSVALVACAGPATSGTKPAAKGAPAATEVRVVTSEWKFEPATILVPVGVPVAVVLENKGAIEHDIAVKELDFHVYARARQTAQDVVTFDKPGTYQVICSLPGHLAAGMQGTLIVGGN